MKNRLLTTPFLRRAVKNRSVRTVELLIEWGADVNAMVTDLSLLQLACSEQSTDIVRVLLQNGANVNLPWPIDGSTPLHMAGCTEFRSGLIRTTTQPLGHKTCGSCAAIVLEHGAEVNVGDDHGATPLHHAAFYDCQPLTTLLINSGANINSRNSGKEIPLHKAASYSSLDVIPILINAGSNIEAMDLRGATPLHRTAAAANELSAASFKMLLGYGANLDAPDNRGRTPLHWMRE